MLFEFTDTHIIISQLLRVYSLPTCPCYDVCYGIESDIVFKSTALYKCDQLFKFCKSRTLSHDSVLKCSVCMQFVQIKCIPFTRDEYKCINDRNCPRQCKSCNLEDAIPFYHIDDNEDFIESVYTFTPIFIGTSTFKQYHIQSLLDK